GAGLAWVLARDVTGLAQRGEQLVPAVLDGPSRGVHPELRVVRHLVRRGDAGEVGDLAATRLRVEALAVATLALLQRGRHVDEEEGAAGGRGPRAGGLGGRVERRERAARGAAAVPGDLGRAPADAADVGLAVLTAEGEARRQVPAHDVAVQAGDAALAGL